MAQQMQLDPAIVISNYERTVAELARENVMLSAGVQQLQNEVTLLRAELEKRAGETTPQELTAEQLRERRYEQHPVPVNEPRSENPSDDKEIPHRHHHV